MNRASVFEWYKRFKEGRESVRDDERHGGRKEVRVDWPNKEFHGCVSIETISAQFDVSVGNVHTIIREELKMRKICAKFVPRVLREDQKERRCHDSRRWSSWSIQIPQFLMLWWPAMKAGSTAMTQRPSERIPRGSMLSLPDPRKPDRVNTPPNFWWFLFFNCTGMIYMHRVLTEQKVNKEYYVEVLREFRKRFGRKRPALFTSGQWHFPRDNAPVHNSILVTDYLTKMGIKTVPYPLYSPDLAPCDLSSRKILESVVMRQLRRGKRL